MDRVLCLNQRPKNLPWVICPTHLGEMPQSIGFDMEENAPHARPIA